MVHTRKRKRKMVKVKIEPAASAGSGGGGGAGAGAGASAAAGAGSVSSSSEPSSRPAKKTRRVVSIKREVKVEKSLRLPRPIVLIESPTNAAFETRSSQQINNSKRLKRGVHNKSTIQRLSSRGARARRR